MNDEIRNYISKTVGIQEEDVERSEYLKTKLLICPEQSRTNVNRELIIAPIPVILGHVSFRLMLKTEGFLN